jgi:pyruvate dehydrogenase E1 component alpha subunit
MISRRLLHSSATGRAAAAATAEFKLPVAFETHDCESPATTVNATKDDLLNFYKQMVVIRRMETASDNLYKSKMIRGFCHLCTGQACSI